MSDGDCMCGGWSDIKPADDDIQKICNEVKGQAEKKTGKGYHQFKAIEYKSQVVAGMNYRIKVQVGGEEYLHLEVFKDGGKCILTGLQDNKTRTSLVCPN